MRADFELVETYRVEPSHPLALPFTLIGSADDREVPLERLAAWAAHSSEPVQEARVQGGHFYPATHEPELVAVVAEALAQHLVGA